jgi:hypothetical protein
MNDQLRIYILCCTVICTMYIDEMESYVFKNGTSQPLLIYECTNFELKHFEFSTCSLGLQFISAVDILTN